MKTITFTLTIEPNEYGPQNVPYIRHLLARVIPDSVGVVRSVEYMGQFDSTLSEHIEYDAYCHGEMEL